MDLCTEQRYQPRGFVREVAQIAARLLSDAYECTHVPHRLVEDGIDILDYVGEAPEDLEIYRPEELRPCRQ